MKTSALATKGIFVIGAVEISAVVLKKVHIIFEHLTVTKPPTTAENPGQSNETQTEAEHRPKCRSPSSVTMTFLDE